jgi:hypothetical protein
MLTARREEERKGQARLWGCYGLDPTGKEKKK